MPPSQSLNVMRLIPSCVAVFLSLCFDSFEYRPNACKTSSVVIGVVRIFAKCQRIVYFFTQLQKIQPDIWPNLYLVSLVDEAFALGGRLSRLIREYKIERTPVWGFLTPVPQSKSGLRLGRRLRGWFSKFLGNQRQRPYIALNARV